MRAQPHETRSWVPAERAIFCHSHSDGSAALSGRCLRLLRLRAGSQSSLSGDYFGHSVIGSSPKLHVKTRFSRHTPEIIDGVPLSATHSVRHRHQRQLCLLRAGKGSSCKRVVRIVKKIHFAQSVQPGSWSDECVFPSPAPHTPSQFLTVCKVPRAAGQGASCGRDGHGQLSLRTSSLRSAGRLWQHAHTPRDRKEQVFSDSVSLPVHI